MGVSKKKAGITALIGSLFIAAMMSFGQDSQTFTTFSSSVLAANVTPAGWGVGIANQRSQEWKDNSLATLQPDVWYDWSFTHTDDPSYMPMVYSANPNNEQIWIDRANSAPQDRIWLLINEPNNLPTEHDPAYVASFTQKWVQETNVAWACCGVLMSYHHEAHFGAVDWMQDYIDAGGEIPDYWAIHIYGSENANQYDQVLTSFEEWAEQNSVIRPIMITETAYTPGFWYEDGTLDEAEAIMDKAYEVFATGRVISVLWYSDHDYHGLPDWELNDLLSENQDAVTEMGQRWIYYRNARPTIPGTSTPTGTPTDTATPTVSPTPTITPTPAPTWTPKPGGHDLYIPYASQ